MPEKPNTIPITGATIEIFPKGGNMNDGGELVTTLAPVAGTPGRYRADSIDEGSYFLVAKSAGRGTVVKDFKLPKETAPSELTKYIGPLNMVAGLPVMDVNIKDKDAANITTGITLEVARIRGVHVSDGDYTVAAVPVGTRQLEIIPSDPEQYQNWKMNVDVTNPMTGLNLVLDPPITLNVTIQKQTTSGTTTELTTDTSSRLFIMDGNTKVREVFTGGANVYTAKYLINGDVTVRAYAKDGVTPRAGNVTYNIKYIPLTSGVVNRTYIWDDSILLDTTVHDSRA